MENFKTTKQVAVSQITLEPMIMDESVKIPTILDNDYDFLGDSCDFS